jgi:hypothetical protein
MAFPIKAQLGRKYTRVALWWEVITNALLAVALLILGTGASSYLARTLGFPPALVLIAAVVLFLRFVVSAARDIYLISKLPSAVAGSGLQLADFGLDASGPAPANPTALLEFEQRMIDMTRPFEWARAITSAILGVLVVVLIFVAMQRVGLPDQSTTVLYLVAALFTLIVVGFTISDLYRTWAIFSIPLSQKKNVVVKPVELIQLIMWLGVIALFAALFVSTGSPQLVASGLGFGGIASWMLISNYRNLVSRPIVNPIDVAPITIDAGETIDISMAGVTMAGAGILQKVGFGRRLPQQTQSSQSGRMLNTWGQNALLVGETRLYFIFVPIGLGDQAPEQVSMMESMLGGKQIRAKLDEMLGTMTLRQIYESDPINFAINLSDVGRLEVKRSSRKHLVAFVDKQGAKISAFIDASPDFDRFEALAHRIGIAPSAVSA